MPRSMRRTVAMAAAGLDVEALILTRLPLDFTVEVTVDVTYLPGGTRCDSNPRPSSGIRATDDAWAGADGFSWRPW
jgi:hypothetical protein